MFCSVLGDVIVQHDSTFGDGNQDGNLSEVSDLQST